MTVPSPTAAPVAAAAPKAAAAPRGPAGAGDVVSTLAGVVESVAVSVGQSVAQGDKVATVEAMKMKTPIIAQRAGKVVSVAVKPGDPVEAGQTILVLS